ncbi:isoamyl acetate-hydrolyzing esterase [Microbotryomycetes sp. JL221]|nr:isoamyl acetate-hydrolyzing esterase [Microbotryomycetes sp. JL221]
MAILGSFALNGLGANLSDLYQRVFDVHNRGYGGYNTRIAIPIAEKWLPRKGEDRPHTALMTIWFGANDAVLPGNLQYVPLEEYKANLHKIVDLIHSSSSPYYSPTTKLCLLTPPVIRPQAWADHSAEKHGLVNVTPDRTVENTSKYAEAVRQVGQERDIAVADVWQTMLDEANGDDNVLDEMLYDGLHLSPRGYEAATKAVKTAIVQYLPELHWDRQSRLYPEWRTLLE